MDEESKNWFRFSKLIIDVGPDILRKCVVEKAQVYFLDDLEKEWHEKVQTIQTSNYVALQWKIFYANKNGLERTHETLLQSWNVSKTNNDTLSTKVLKFEEWKNDIEKHLHNDQTQADALLLSWLKQIETRICDLNAIPPILQSCTTEFSELFQRSRLDLVGLFKTHYDEFLTSCRRIKSGWAYITKDKLKEVITGLENDRKNMKTSWNEVLEKYLQTLTEGIKRILTSRKQRLPNIVDIKELNDLFNEFEAKDINSFDLTHLQDSCDIWHLELGNLFNKWLKTIDNVPDRRFAHGDIFANELELYPSISLHQVRNILDSKQSKLKKHISKKKVSKLFPPSGFPQLQECDTSLLFIVLKHLVCPPMEGWQDDPPQFDQSLGADILRLKSYRNEIVGHIQKTKIDRWEFDVLWKSVQDVLCRLASRLGRSFESDVRTQVDKIKTCSFNSNQEGEFQRILQWCKNDILEEFRGLAKINQCLNILESVESIQRERPPPPIERRRGVFGAIGDGFDSLFGSR